MTNRRILIAGIGNIFFGDDAFGSEVARRMMRRAQPDGVWVEDFGIRGLDLAYSLLEGYATVILIDAVSRGQPPGTLYLIEPDITSLKTPHEAEEMMDAHGMGPERVLRTAASLGAKFGRILLVGCEPTPINTDPEGELQMELSEPMERAVEEAIRMIGALVVENLQDERTMAGAGASSDEKNSGAAKEFSNDRNT